MSAQPARSQRAQEKFAVIEKYLVSGQTQKMFCQTQGLAYSSFQFWLKKYREANVLPSDSASSSNSFIPLEFRPQGPRSRQPRYVIEYPNGVVIRVCGKVKPELLTHLIEAAGF
jgi:transposase-like protein